MKNGFTLAELMAVLALIAILSVIATTTITSKIKDSRVTVCQTDKRTIEDAAKNYVTDQIYSSNTVASPIMLESLKNDNYLDQNMKITNPKNGEDYEDKKVFIYITTSTDSTNSKYTYKIFYETNEITCSK